MLEVTTPALVSLVRGAPDPAFATASGDAVGSLVDPNGYAASASWDGGGRVSFVPSSSGWTQALQGCIGSGVSIPPYLEVRLSELVPTWDPESEDLWLRLDDFEGLELSGRRLGLGAALVRATAPGGALSAASGGPGLYGSATTWTGVGVASSSVYATGSLGTVAGDVPLSVTQQLACWPGASGVGSAGYGLSHGVNKAGTGTFIGAGSAGTVWLSTLADWAVRVFLFHGSGGAAPIGTEQLSATVKIAISKRPL